MDNLVTELAQLLIDDKAFLFIDASLPLGPGKPPLTQEIAEELATELKIQPDARDLSNVAQRFEKEHGRHALIMALKSKCEAIEKRSNLLYYRLAKALPAGTKVVTTQFDRRLEHVLRSAQRKCEVIKDKNDVLFFDNPHVTLIKIWGGINLPDHLVVTKTDISRAITNLSDYNDTIRQLLIRKYLIFLGYDLQSPVFENLYDKVAQEFNLFRLNHAIVCSSDGDTIMQAGPTLKVYTRDPLAFLQELLQVIEVRLPHPDGREEALPLPPRPDHPYKALDSFTAKDVAIFAGRREESHRLANRILAHHHLALYGESGSGKTSLLQAGAGPLLAKEGCLLAVCRLAAGQESLQEQIRRVLIEAGEARQLARPGENDLPTLIKAWQRILDQPIVLALDQFEQLFLVSADERHVAIKELSQLWQNRELDLRLVLIIREDFLGRLETLSDELPGLLETRFRLERLDETAAKAAIIEPAERFNVTWEPALVKKLLDELEEGANGWIMPPQLQIACHYLYEKFAKPILETKPEAKLTLAHFERIGSLSEILSQHLDGAVAKFPPRQQELVRSLLVMLVSGSNTKQRLPLAELARAVDMEPQETQEVLDQLTQPHRLLQRYAVRRAGRTEWEYELIHDYLVERINNWLEPEFKKRKAVLELVRLALPAWEKDKTLLPPDSLRLVVGERGRIRFSVAELEMIYAAAVSYDDNPVLWAADLDRAAGSSDNRRQILLQLLKQDVVFARRHAAVRLADFPDPEVAQKLAEATVKDPDEEVREAAAQAIAGLVGAKDPRAGQSAVKQVGAAIGSEHDQAAWQALTIIRDQEPASQAFLPGNLRGRLQRRVWRVRLQDRWPQILSQTVRGALGGLLGGMAIYGLFLEQNATPGEMRAGLFLNALLGFLSAGGSALVGSTLRSLQDYTHPWRVWFIMTVVGASLFGLGLTLPSLTTPGNKQIIEKLSAGALLGLGLIGAAVIPQGAHLLRLAIAILAGAVAFGLVGLIGPPFNPFNTGNWWLLPMGGIAGLAFFWALASDLTDKR